MHMHTPHPKRSSSLAEQSRTLGFSLLEEQGVSFPTPLPYSCGVREFGWMGLPCRGSNTGTTMPWHCGVNLPRTRGGVCLHVTFFQNSVPRE